MNSNKHSVSSRRLVLFLCLVVLIQSPVKSQSAQATAKNPASWVLQEETGNEHTNSTAARVGKKIDDLSEKLALLSGKTAHEVYTITLAADVPDNKRPHKVYVKKQPGHVFIILQQKDTVTGKSRSQVWGFYPVRPVSSVFLRTVKCALNDNGGRSYEAGVTWQLDEQAFSIVKEKAIALTEKRYNLNKYNCYDYAVEIFNSIPGIEKLPVTHVRFPLIFGKGGSPCGLYRDLVELKKKNTTWSSAIHIGSFTAPVSDSEDH